MGQSVCVANIGQIAWTTDPSVTSTGPCRLEPNTDYYFNYVHANASDGYATSGCPANQTYCGILGQQTQYFPD
ncbi:MAG: hypothetical protein KDH96_13460 [Candidatus Riesia sp.]|nr:hypothetical protein [Candidatus Riesia sp.]